MKRRADRRRIDQMMAAYVEWKEHSVAVQSTYDRWTGARRTDSRAAYLAYAVALDREARASEECARMVVCARGRSTTVTVASDVSSERHRVVLLAFSTAAKNRLAGVANWVIAFQGRGRRQRTIIERQVFARARAIDATPAQSAAQELPT